MNYTQNADMYKKSEQRNKFGVHAKLTTSQGCSRTSPAVRRKAGSILSIPLTQSFAENTTPAIQNFIQILTFRIR